MAIMRGPAMSGFSGKVGNLVGRKKVGGGYVVSAYQPQVFNPSTEGQRVGRSAFALLGQLARQLGKANLVGLRDAGRAKGGNWFSAFVGENYGSVIWNASRQVSSLDIPGIVLAKGVGKNVGSASLLLTYADSLPENLLVNLELPSDLTAEEVVKTHVVAMVYDAEPKIFAMHADGWESAAEFYVGDPAGRPSPYLGKLVYVWAFLETLDPNASRTSYGANEYQTSPNVTSDTETSAVASRVFSDSLYCGSITIENEPQP